MSTKTYLLTFLILILVGTSFSQTNELTYQGKLVASGNAANTPHDFEFRLCAAVDNCTLPLEVKQRPGVEVSNGVFTVKLDFDPTHFNGADRWLEIAVRAAGGPTFTTLTPRQRVTSAPYSIKSLNSENATIATNATQLNGISGDQYVITTDPRMTDGRSPLPGSSSYIQNNPSSQQTSSSFNISDNGTVGGTLSAAVVNATTQFNIRGARAFTIYDPLGFGDTDTFAGSLAGIQNTTGRFNSFFGCGAGQSNNTGTGNSFFGCGAGGLNTGGSDNAFFGRVAGQLNAADHNSFFGGYAGQSNVSGSKNTIIGYRAEVGANDLTNATAIGALSQVAQSNSLVLGSINGINGATADTKVGIGTTRPSSILSLSGEGPQTFGMERRIIANTSGSPFGIRAGGAALGAVNGVGGSLYLQSGISTGDQGSNIFFQTATPGSSGSTDHHPTTKMAIYGQGNVVIGLGDAPPPPPDSRLSVYRLGTATPSGGVGLTVENGLTNTVIDGTAKYGVSIRSTGEFTGGTGTSTVNYGLYVGTGGADRNIAASFNGGDVEINGGHLMMSSLAFGGELGLCVTYPSPYRVLLCSSSLRYKTNIGSFTSGLDLIDRLRPITFNWKESGAPDLGLGAEDVAAVEPLLATYNNKGEIEGVKYDRIGVVLINAVKEQQAQIEALQKTVDLQARENEAPSANGYLQINNHPILSTMLNSIKEQQSQIENQKQQNRSLQEQNQRQQEQINALTKLLCEMKPKAAICKEEEK